MTTINLQCNSTFKCLLQAEIVAMTGRACMGEVLIKVWLKSIKTSECTSRIKK